MKTTFSMPMRKIFCFLHYSLLFLTFFLLAGQNTLFAQVPAAPTVVVQWNNAGTLTPAPRCGHGALQATASGAPVGGVYRWYSTQTGGVILTSNPFEGITVSGTNSQNFSLAYINRNITFYVAVFANNAESPRTPVNFTVSPEARILNGFRAGLCGNPSLTLEGQPVTGATYEWYYEITGGLGQKIKQPVGATSSVVVTSPQNYVFAVSLGACTTESTITISNTYNPNAYIIDGVVEAGGTERIDRYCTGETNTLNAQPDEGSTYAWLFSTDNITFTSVGATGIALSPANNEGYYRVRVNKNGCFQDSDPVRVIKSNVPTASISINGSPAFCPGENRVLTAVTDLGKHFVWEYAPFATATFTTAAGSTNGSTYTATQAGAYRVTVSASVGSQCVKTSDPITLSIVDEPIVEKTDASLDICKGTKGTLTAKDQAPGVTVTYQWYYSSTPFTSADLGTALPDGAVKSYTNVDKPGFYRVKVTPASCPEGIFSAITKTVLIEAKIANGASVELCDGQSQSLQGQTMTGATGYAWKYSPTATGTFALIPGANQPSHTAFTTGFYRFELTHPSCPLQTADIEVKQKSAVLLTNNPTSFCVSDGTGVVLKAEAGGTSYLWSYSGNKNGPFAPAPGTNNTENYTAKASGWYKIQLSKGGCPLAATVEVKESIEPLPVSIVEKSPVSFCQNDSPPEVILNATPKGLNIYRWSKSSTEGGTYTPIPASNTSEFAASEAGWYKVEVFEQVDGCSKQSAAVLVESLPVLTKASIVGEPTLFMCPDGNITLNASPAHPSYTYEWYKAAHPVTASTPFTLITGFTSASYTTNELNTAFKVKIKTLKCGEKLSEMTHVIKDPAFTSATITGASSYCKGNGITLKTNITDGTYSWKKVGSPDVEVSNKQELFVTAAGTYYVEITRLGCFLKSGNHAVTEKEAVDKPVILPPSPKICSGGSVVLSSSITGTGITYAWKYSADVLRSEADYKAKATEPNGTNSTFTATANGFYALVVAQDGCGEAMSEIITVNPLNAPKPKIKEGTKVTLCKASASNILITTDVLGADKYVWQKSSSANGAYTNLAGSNSEAYLATEGGFYRVQVTDPTTKCEVASDPIEVEEKTQLDKPLISYLSSANLCSNGQLVVNSLSVSTTYTYLWEFSANNSVFAPAIGTNNKDTYTATQKGFYRLKLVGCGDVTSDALDVKDPVLPVVKPSLNTLKADFCDSYNLETPSSTGRSYQWFRFTTSGYTIITGATQNTYLVKESGLYQVAVTEKGCTETSQPAELTKAGSMPAPIIEQSPLANLCGDGKISLSVKEKNPYHDYQWLRLDGTIYKEVGKGIPYSATTTGSYKVTVTSLTSPSCTSNTSNEVIINSPKASKPVNIKQGTTIAMCDKADYVLSVNDQSLDAQNYIWQRFDGTNFITIQVGKEFSQITITEGGQYRVTVFNNSCGVTSAVSTVTKSGATPDAFIDEGNPLSMCEGGKLKMTSRTQSSGFTYQWQYSASTNPLNWQNRGTNSPTYEVNPLELGFYQLIISSDCTPPSTSPVVRVSPKITPPIAVTIPATASFCAGQDVYLTTSFLGADRYEWFRNGALLSTSNSETYAANVAGDYTVLVYKDGCSIPSNVSKVTLGGANKPVIKGLPSTPLCGNGQVELSFTGGSNFYTPKWQYSSNGVTFTDAPAPNNADTYLAKEKGYFYKVVIDAGTACGKVESDAIKIGDPQPLVAPTIRQTSPVGMCKGGDRMLDIADTYDRYEWYFAPKASPSAFELQVSSTLAQDKQYFANRIGFYKVKVFKNSCSAESATVEVVETTTMPKPVISGSSIINICADGKAKMETITQATLYSYQWKRAPLTATPTNAAAYSPISGATNAIYEATQDGFYLLETTSLKCTGTGVSDYIKVNPYVVSTDKVAIEQRNPTEFCKDILLTVATGTAFKWYHSASTKDGAYTFLGSTTEGKYSVSKAGWYKVGVTQNGCEETTEPIELKQITTMPKPVFANGSLVELCSTGKLALRILNFSESHTYTWEYAETAKDAENNAYKPITGATGRIYETTQGGFYRIQVDGAPNNSCGKNTSDPITVEVGQSLEKAEIAQGAKATFCPNGDVVLNAVPANSKYKYAWEKAPLNADTYEKIVGASDSNYVVKSEGKYRVKITSAGCEATSTATVVQESSTMTKPTIKQGKKVVFCNKGANVEVQTQSTTYVYTWQYAPKSTDNFVNVGSGSLIFATTAGFYRIQVSSEGCGQNTSDPVELIRSDEPPIAKIEQGKSTTFCKNSVALLSAVPQTDNNVETTTGFIFRWLYSKDGKETFQPVGYLNTHQTNVEGFYQLTVARDGCFAASEPVEVRQTEGMPPATIDKGTKVSFCDGGSVDLKVTSKGVDFKYAWEYSETQNGTFNLVAPNREVLTVNKIGYYRLTVSKEGCGSSSTLIEVFPTSNRPEATILQGTSTFFCGEGNIRLEAFRSQGYTYSWAYSTEIAGTYQARGTDSVFVARTPGFYRLTVNNNGCSVVSTPIQVQRLETMPPAEFLQAGTQGFCKGSTTKLQSKIKSGAITYKWFYASDGRNYEPIGTSTPELTINKGGSYKFEMSQTSCGTSSSAAIQVIEVDPAVFPNPLLLTGAFTSVCLGESVELKAATVPGSVTYLWSGPDGFSAKTQNALVQKTTTRSSGTYTFVANLTGCEQIAKVNLQVNPLPNYTLNLVDKICEGTSNGLIEAVSTGSGMTYSFNGGAFASQNKFDQLRAGTYKLAARTPEGCQTSADIVIREVSETMKVSASAPSDWIYKNETIQLSASGGTTYSWSPSTGLSATNIPNPVASPRETTEYTVKVSSKDGCGVAKVKIEVRINYTLTINNVLTPNGDGSNDLWYIKNIDNHPNADIKVYDRWGVLVYSKSGGYNNDWDGRDNSGGKLPTGAYYYIISNLADSNDPEPKTGSITIFR